MKRACSRLGHNLDASESELVVLRREGILVDADRHDGRLRRQLAAGESIDIDLAAVRSRCRPCERGQLGFEFIGIVGQCVQRGTRDNHRARIVLGVDADLRPLCGNCGLLTLLGDRQTRVEREVRGSRDFDALLDEHAEARSSHRHHIGARIQTTERIGAIVLRGYDLRLA